MSTLTNAIRADLAEQAAKRWAGIKREDFAEFLDKLLHEKPSGRSLQLWPGGKSVVVRDLGEGKFEIGDSYNGPFREPTEDERRAVRIEELAERYADRDVWCCDSSLVDDALKLDGEGDLGKEFSYENVKNLRPDPSDWDLEQCKEWLEDKGHDLPDPNPWSNSRDGLIRLIHGDDMADAIEEFLGHDEADGPAPELSEDARIVMGASDDMLRETAIEQIEDETIDGLHEWRQAVSDNAEDEEVYEWWRVSNWLGEKLVEIGECVMDNNYGYWWGRCCTGQGFIMDGVLQRVAARHV